MKTIAAASILALALAACSPSAENGASDAPAAAPQGEDAPASAEATGVTLQPVAEGLEFPWGIGFLPDGTALVTEVAGGIRVISADGTLSPEPLANVPTAFTDGQGGYLGLAVDPDFANNRLIYMSFSEGDSSANRTAVMRARLSDDLSAVQEPTIIFRSTDRNTAYHYGSRLDFMTDGTLLVTLGEGFRYMQESQNTDNYHGKIVRIRTDGSIPEDNPFFDGEAPAVWSYGHRNVQGLYVDDATGTVYANEHGPKGGDEINVIEPGNNYGWPVITYGVNYDGTIITTETEKEGMEQPLVKWVPSIAPGGLVLYRGDVYPEWEGDLFSGGMEGPAGLKLVRTDLDADGNVVGQEDLLTDVARPIRDVALGPDGYLYVVTKELDSGLYRVVKN